MEVPSPTHQSVAFDMGHGIVHPSTWLHKHLLVKHPNAKMVITQDSDWISVLTDEDSALPKPEILCTRILDSHEVCENDGIVTLERKPSRRAKSDIIIAVMGPTGAGKSTVINEILGPGQKQTMVSHSLDSCTQEVQAFEWLDSQRRRIVLVDTPGFNDTNASMPVDVPPATTTSTKTNTPPPSAQIFKNTILFASKFAGNASIPWIKLVTESIIDIIQRFDIMKLNEQVAMDLQNDVKAFLFIVARAATQDINDDIIKQFQGRVQSIQISIQSLSNNFLNAEESRGAITRLRQDLDNAVQLIQTGLQIATIAKIDEFMTWKAEIEALPCPSVHQKIENSTISADRDLTLNNNVWNIRIENIGIISSGESNVDLKNEWRSKGLEIIKEAVDKQQGVDPPELDFQTTKLTIYTNVDRATRKLNRSTDLLLTLTPLPSPGTTWKTIVWKVLHFEKQTVQTRQVIWSIGMGFCVVEERQDGIIAPGDLRLTVRPGHAVVLNGSTDASTSTDDPNSSGVQQEQQQFNLEVKMPFESDEIAVCNQTNEPQRFALCTIDPTKFEADTFSLVVDLDTDAREVLQCGRPVIIHVYAVSPSQQCRERQPIAATTLGTPLSVIDIRTLGQAATFRLYSMPSGRYALEKK
jgi:hypothetical protein